MSKIHTVRSGDTLGEIAKRYNTTVAQLAKANKISNPNQISVGQKIVVDGFEAAASKPSSGSSSYTVKSGDTLGAIATRFGVTVSQLASANKISNPNKISVGQKLVIPGKDGFDTKPAPSKPAPSTPAPSQPTTGGAAGPVRDNDGRTFPTSADGTPMFRQGDPQWGSRRLGTGSSLSAAGCAMTSMAMAVSKITGQVINPGEMDAHLDKNGGYSGNALVWGAAAKMGGLGATKSAWNLNTINQQIDAGRPVVIGVDYKAGSYGGANGTDHWIAVTGRGKDSQGKPVYYANDPATGKQVTLHESGGRLVGGNNYKTTGELVVLTGGNPRPGTAPAPTKPSTPSAPATPAPAASLKGVTLPAGDLEKGAKGEGVKQLQTALVKLGHLTAAEMATGPGIFGEKTQAALKKFQAKQGIEPAAGYYGPKTRAVMEKLGGKVEAGAPVTGPAPTTGGASDVSLSQLKAIMPALSDARAREVLPHLNKAMAEAGINTKQRKAMFLAQLGHESASFRYFEEIASGAAYEGREDLGNTEPGDGKRFKGRGPIQLTGRANYRAAGKALGLDLENNPKRAADLDVGFRTAAWYWNTRNLNTYADQGNFREVTRRINGGYNGLADREAYYQRALNVL